MFPEAGVHPVQTPFSRVIAARSVLCTYLLGLPADVLGSAPWHRFNAGSDIIAYTHLRGQLLSGDVAERGVYPLCSGFTPIKSNRTYLYSVLVDPDETAPTGSDSVSLSWLKDRKLWCRCHAGPPV